MKGNNLLKQILWLGIALVVVLALTSSPALQNKRTFAQGSETPYGGQNLFQLECTCTSTTLIFLYDAASSGVLGLVYQSGLSTLFNNENIYGTYLLGSYMENSGICEMEVGPYCIEITSDGQMGSAPGTGTSGLWDTSRDALQELVHRDYQIQSL